MHVVLQTSVVPIHLTVNIKHGQQTADCGLGIKHGLTYKTRTKQYALNIKHGLRYKTRAAD